MNSSLSLYLRKIFEHFPHLQTEDHWPDEPLSTGLKGTSQNLLYLQYTPKTDTFYLQVEFPAQKSGLPYTPVPQWVEQSFAQVLQRIQEYLF